MNGSATEFLRFMEGPNNRYVIPVYQRNYDWNYEHCKRLYDDLVKVIKQDRKDHFFGSIVSIFNPDGEGKEFQIIDGQQRITTVSLLFLAMYHLIEDGTAQPENPKLGKKIYEQYLVDDYDMTGPIIKLKPVKDDKTAYDRLYGAPDDYVIDSRITENYLYFYDRIQDNEISVDELFMAISKLKIIDIVLGEGDDPQLIFESLNSTGLELDEGDKIRNYVLMNQPTKKQNEYYENYWNPIEKYTNHDPSAFIRDYLSVKQQAIPSQKKIYTTFKDYVEYHDIPTETLLKDMLAYARRYQILLEGGTESDALNGCIDRLNRLETTVTRPFFLEVLRLKDEGALSIGQVTDIFLITENYLFRRTICDLPTNALSKIFLLLHKEIMRYDSTDSDYVEKFKYALDSKKDRARFPDDEEFAKAFSEKQIYLMNNKNKIYVLERLENYGIAEDKDIYRHCDAGTYSIEHIMPQHLTPAWQEALGDDYEHIHDEWLHRAANLTLTAYNSKYSNRTFEEKKTMKSGFIESGIKMNMQIAQNDKWTEDELERRDRYLTDRALTIWQKPATTYKPAEKQLDSYTLEDEDELSGRQIVKFAFKNTETPVESWVEMYRDVLQILYNEDKTIITRLAVSDDEGIAMHFSTSTEGFNKCEEIGDGIYVWTNTNTQSKLSVLNKLFVLYDESPSDLVFYLRDEDERDIDEPGSIFELRRRYWAYALPVIKEANEDNGAFSKVNPSKENWVNGFFGISGFDIGCIANYGSARVEMYFGKAQKEENKRVFDYLHAHKNEIENALGKELTWQRGDDIKSSKIVVEVQGISIENENNWQQMASFHATWSRKFYDILVPYIEDAMR